AASLLLADGLHLAGELGEAVEGLRRARQHHPDDFWINDMLGGFLVNADPSRADEAGRYFSAAPALRPRSYFVYDNLALALTGQCRWSEAVAAYETAIRQNANFLKARIDLSECLVQQGKLDEAIAVCRDVLQRKPGFAYASSCLAAYLG